MARFQFVEAGLGDARGDLGGDAAALVGFVGDDDAMGLFNRGRQDRRQIEGHESARIDDFHFDAFFGELLRRPEDATCTVYDVAINVTSLPLRFTSATPKGIGLSFSGTSPRISSSRV